MPFLSHPQPLLFGLSPEFRVCSGHFYDLRVARLGVGGIRAQLPTRDKDGARRGQTNGQTNKGRAGPWQERTQTGFFCRITVQQLRQKATVRPNSDYRRKNTTSLRFDDGDPFDVV